MKGFKHILASSFLCALCASQTHAAQGLVISPTVVENSIRQLDIMSGDKNGDLNLNSYISRAEFATMLVAASNYKNTSTHYGYTLFPDVPSTYWAAGYIKVVVEHGYMYGYLDGTFAPNSNVLIEEAVTSVLNLLGYNSSTLSGLYPYAQMSKFYELDLDEYFEVELGMPITREQCMYLFYNLLNTSTIDGTVYANQLGYTTTSNGLIDTIALTNQFTKGPYIAGSNNMPANLAGSTTVYYNDKIGAYSDLNNYDVCYYNSKLNTLWIYNNRVTGRLTSIDSQLSPSEIVVAGQTYTLETTDVKYKFGYGGDYREGDLVTLLLGNYGNVADAIPASITDTTIVGVVLGRGISQVDDGSGNLAASNYVQMMTTDGTVHVFDSDGKYYNAGRVVEIQITDGVQTTQGISSKSISGKMNATGTMIGDHKLAEDVKLFEVSSGSSTYGVVYLSRLLSQYIESDDVRYYTTNARGEIDSIIFEDVTGDLANYTLLTKVTEISAGTTMVGQYSYIHNGTEGFEYVENRVYKLSKGGSVFLYEDGELDEIQNLESGTVGRVNALSVSVDGITRDLADNVQVYELYNNQYQSVKLEDISNTTRYKLTAYYDKDLFSAGGQVRIILAEAIR